MNILIPIILFIAYTLAVGFGVFQWDEKRHSAVEMDLQLKGDRVAVRTEVQNRYIYVKKQEDTSAHTQLASKVEQDIKDHPAPASCPAFNTGLLNDYIDRANSPQRMYVGPTKANAPTKPSNPG